MCQGLLSCGGLNEGSQNEGINEVSVCGHMDALSWQNERSSNEGTNEVSVCGHTGALSWQNEECNIGSKEDEINDPLITALKEVRSKNGKNIVFSHVNINSLGNEREYMKELLISKYVDVLCISESKLSDKYKDVDLSVNGFKMYRKDRSSQSGGLFVWFRSDIPHKRVEEKEYTDKRHHIESMVFEMMMKNQKWFLLLTYKHPKVSDNVFLPHVFRFYESIEREAREVILLGDINTDMQYKNDKITTELCQVYGLSNLITQPTCFKNPEGTLLDPILVMNKNKFQNAFNIHCASSDFHNIVGCATRLKIPPQKPVKIQYRSYKNFNEKEFKIDVGNIPFQVSEIFEDIHDQYWFSSQLLTDVINEHAPLKSRTIKTQQIPYMHSDLRREMYRRNMLKNESFKFRTQENREKYRKQRNLVTNMRRDAIKAYFISNCRGNVSPKQFWDCIRPFLSDKSRCQENIILNENGTIVTDRTEICNLFNDFFCSIAETIGIPDEIDTDSDGYLTSVLARHEGHSSIKAIKNVMKDLSVSTFDFDNVSVQMVEKALSKVNANKATGYDTIPPKLVKMSPGENACMLTNVINKGLNMGIFPDDMKKAEISPIFKKKDDMIKDNYRPVSILIIFAKVFETMIADQLVKHFEPLFNNLLCAYRKKYGCENILIKLVDSWKQALDQDEYVGTIMMDLSKAFDCIPHGLLICKLKAYGLSDNACKLMCSYLSGRKQRVKLSDGRSSWMPLKKGIPQGSCLGPILFNIFVNDLFLFIQNCKLYNYADDNTLSVSGKSMDYVVEALRSDTSNAIDWFTCNFMQANPEKFQVMYMKPIRAKQEQVPEHLEVNGVMIKRDTHVKLLGLTIDDKLKFDVHINNICAKASKQLNVLNRFKHVFNVGEKTTIYNTFVLANFNYCPVVWHFCGVTLTRKMEKVQERALRFLLNDFNSEYDVMLQKVGLDTLFLRRLKVIACEVYKAINDLSPSFMNEIFNVKEVQHDLRDNVILVQPKFGKIRYGQSTLSYYGPHIWNLLPSEAKTGVSINVFKDMLSTWEGPHCQCNLCYFIP